MSGTNFRLNENSAQAVPHTASVEVAGFTHPSPPCVHEWRLIQEIREKNWGTGVWAIVARRWFCVHCRTVDVTDEHGGVK